MSTTSVAEPEAVSTDAQTDSHLANQAELNKLMLEQISIAKRVEAQRVKSAYDLYQSLSDFLTNNKLSITDFISICENRHQELHGKKPVSLFRNINFTQAGKARTLSIKYQDKANPANVWTGRGKQPLWLTSRIDEGYDASDFLTESFKEEAAKTKRATSKTVSERSANASIQKQRRIAKRPNTKATPTNP